MKSTTPVIDQKTERTWLLVLMLVSIATLGVHFYLSVQHYQLKLGLNEGQSVCNISSLFNCDSVAISRYSTFMNIPVALLGLLSQLVFLTLLLAVRFELSAFPSHLRRLLLWFSIFVAGVSVVMGFVSATRLGTFCLFCITAYVLSFIQLLGAWKVQHSSPWTQLSSDLKTLFTQTRWVLVLVILIPSLSWVSNSVILDSYGLGQLKLITADALNRWENSPAQNFTEEGLALGPAAGKASMVIVEFADFLCPHCKTASPSLEAFTHSHPDVRMVFKAFPLDGKCNQAIQREGDGTRCRLSAAVLCAEKLNQKGWQASHWVFARQEELSRGIDVNALTERMGTELSLDSSQLKECLNSDQIQEQLLSMAKEGATAEIQGTPSIFVNGKLLEKGQFIPVLEALHKKLNP